MEHAKSCAKQVRVSYQLQLAVKRMFDILISLFLVTLLFVIPVFEILFLLVRFTSKGPAIFYQVRIGKDKKPFRLYKFRTMILEQYDADGKEIMSEDRITPIGKILRKTSLDELPQLFNVLGGSMSLIGPRPMLDYQAERCDTTESGRFAVRPGITGLAQVKGRNNIPWSQRIIYDLEYVRDFSIWMDLKIFFMTATALLRHSETEVNVSYRGADKFSKHYHEDGEQNHQK